MPISNSKLGEIHKSKTDLSNEDKQKYWDLFINRSDTYSIQGGDGRYKNIKQELTSDILFGIDTIGAYQLNTENKIKWACIDIDIRKEKADAPDFKLEDWLPLLQKQAKLISEHLKSLNVPSYMEFSGRRGFHLWIFFNKLEQAAGVRRSFNEILKTAPKVNEYIGWEFFPKQDTLLEGRFGNLVKLPLQLHRKSGDYSYFVDDEFNPINGLQDIEQYELIHDIPTPAIISQCELPFQHKTEDRTIFNLAECKDDEIKFIPSAIEFLREKINNHEDWIKCGFSLTVLGEKGKEYFQRLSDNPLYKDSTEDIDKQFTELLHSSRGKVNISNAFSYC